MPWDRFTVPIAFLSDFDGTLVDSEDQIVRSKNQTWVEWRHNPLTRETIHSFIGTLAKEFAQDLNFSTAEEEDFISRFRQLLAIDIVKENPVFLGVRRFIEKVSAATIPLGIVTSKASHLAIQIIEISPLIRFFQQILKTDNFPPKLGPDIILRCRSALNVDRA